MARYIQTRVSNTKPVTGEPFPRDKFPGFNPTIYFYTVEDDGESYSEDESVIRVKFGKSQAAIKLNT